jgi:ribonuclease R
LNSKAKKSVSGGAKKSAPVEVVFVEQLELQSPVQPKVKSKSRVQIKKVAVQTLEPSAGIQEAAPKSKSREGASPLGATTGLNNLEALAAPQEVVPLAIKPKTRRARPEVLLVDPESALLEPVVVESETVEAVKLEVTEVPTSALTQAPKKTRGRKKAIPEAPQQLELLPLETPDAVRLEPESVDETLIENLDAETLKPIPVPEASKPTVRARKAGRTNIFETQKAPLDPLEALLEFFRANPRAHQVRDIAKRLPAFDYERLGGRKGLEDSLENLVAAGRLTLVRRHTYGLPRDVNLVVGRYSVTGNRGGIVQPETPGMKEFSIDARDSLFAWHGDRVVVREERSQNRSRGVVIRILERDRDEVVGTLEYRQGYAILRPDENKIPHRIVLMPSLDRLSAGARIVAKLHWPENTGEDEPFGEISSVLGISDSPEVETQAVVVKFDLRDEFPADVMLETEKIPREIPIKALQGRVDLRVKRVFTIDGEDAKDFDDAIHIEPLGNGNFLVGVHIADVSHYVTDGSKLDVEAKTRATSVYLPGKVLPMLPERLSNGVCSLVPFADRLTVSALVELSPEGDVVNYAVRNSVIHSKARLTYNEVQSFSEGKSAMPDHARDVEGDLHLLLKLTTKMREKRFRDGSLDFKLSEVKVVLEPDGSPRLVPVREETARGLIEDLMLLANRLIAAFLLANDAPALFRIHEVPAETRFKELLDALNRMGVTQAGLLEPTPQAYQQILASVRGTPQESAVNSLLLRSLRQAKYSSENKGHFGLAFSDYLHFTSPIRRYPDLLVHRVLKLVIAQKLNDKKRETLRESLPELGEFVSERERNATSAERDLNKYYQCKWAQGKIGETWRGYISGVMPFGVFVTLENGVEGLMRLEDMKDDQYSFIQGSQAFKGRQGRMFRLGTPVRVRIERVNAVGREIDLALPVKENTMGKFRNRPGGAGVQKPAMLKGDNRRRVVVLDGKMHGEYSRPVKVTARKLYFGEWTRENMEADERGAGSENRPNNNPNGSRPRPSAQPNNQARVNPNQHPRPNPNQHPRQNPNQAPRPNTEARVEGSTEPRVESRTEPRVEGRNDPRRRFNRPKNPNPQNPNPQNPNPQNPATQSSSAPVVNPAASSVTATGQPAQARPKFEPQKRRFEERRPKPDVTAAVVAPVNHNRAQKGPLEGSTNPVPSAPRVERPRVRPVIAGAEGAQPATPANLVVGDQRQRRRRR